MDKMMKQLSTKILLTTLISMVGGNVFASYDFYAENADGIPISYKIINDGTELEVVAARPCSSLVIPEEVTYEGSALKVTSIGEKAFKGYDNLITSITFPRTLKNIGYDAFYECRLSAVYISDLEAWCNVKTDYYGSSPFEWGRPVIYLNGEEVKDLVIPNTVTNIENYALYGWTGITSVTIPNSVTNIGSWNFTGCTNLTRIEIRATTPPSLGNNTFVKKLDIPLYVPAGSVEAYKTTSPWSSFSNILPLSVSGDPIEINGIFYVLSDESKTAEVRVNPSKYSGDIIIPEKVSYNGVEYTVKSIKDHAFFECPQLTSVITPNTITSIGKCAFAGCKHLKTVTLSNSINMIEDQAFFLCHELTTMVIPEGVTSIGICAFEECYAYAPEIPNGVTTIGSAAFKECGFRTLTIPNSVTSIGEGAFRECLGLKEVYCLAETVPTTDSGAFSDCPQQLIAYVPAGSVDAYKAVEPWSKLSDVRPIGGYAKYTLTYIVDGEIYKTYELSKGDVISPETAPTKEGYTFSGWSDLPATMPENNVIVTGSFTINMYKLSYQVDGATYKSYDVEYGASITPETAPSKEGYTFSGWSEIPSTMPANDVTVSGKFAINKYKLTYMVDGAEYKKYDVEYGAAITPEPTPTKDGYSFSGWSEIPQTMPAMDVTITGTFSRGAYKLTYMVDGEVYKTIGYDFSDAIIPEPAPTKEGYTFSGWSDIPKTMPAEDVTVKGTFTINKYKLTYQVDGATYKSYDVEYGASITPEAAPTKEGYTFSGWSDIPKTMPAKDVTITGTFTKKDEQQHEDPQTNIIREDVVYEIEGGHVSVTHSDNANGELKIEATVVINGKTYEVTVIAKDAFKESTGLTSVEIPNSIATIGESAFEGCTGLANIEIGNGIKDIGSKAFAYLSESNVRTRGADDGLHVYCEASLVPATASDAFEGTDIAHATLHVPEDLMDMYRNVSPWNGFGTIEALKGTGINAIIVDRSDAQIFDIQGNRLDNVRKGLNIIRMSDGKVKKVLAK